MEISQILEELSYDIGELPRDAIESAVIKKQLITPHLLLLLKDAIERVDEIIEDESYQGHIYALYLLAQFRHTQSCEYIIKLFSFPGEISYSIAGDVLTEDLDRILASVCYNNIDLIKNVIENPMINEYVRGACQSCLVQLVGCGMITRDEVVKYFISLLETKLEKKPSYVWDNLASACCLLHPKECKDLIFEAFDKELIDSDFISIEDIEKALEKNQDETLFYLFKHTELVEDTISEMEKWIEPYFFSKKNEE